MLWITLNVPSSWAPTTWGLVRRVKRELWSKAYWHMNWRAWTLGFVGCRSYAGQAKGIAMSMHNLVDQPGLRSWCGLGGMHNMSNRGWDCWWRQSGLMFCSSLINITPVWSLHIFRSKLGNTSQCSLLIFPLTCKDGGVEEEAKRWSFYNLLFACLK